MVTYSSPSVLGLVLGLVEHLIELARDRRLGVAAAWGSGPISARDLLPEGGDVDAELLEKGDDDALVLLEQRGEQVDVVDERIAGAAREGESVLDGLGGLYGEAIGVEHAGFRFQGSAFRDC